MRAVLYARVSLDPRDVGRSVAEQEAECRAVAERNGWDLVETFVDNDRSASRYATKDRPSYRRLIEFIAAGGCDVLVAWESSRLTRDLAAFVELRDLCRERGVRWSYGGRLLDLSDDGDQFAAVIDAAVNERASAETSKRVQRSVRANAAKGRPHGRNLFGYRRVYDPTTGQLDAVVTDESQAEVLREVARRFLAGESFRALATDLTERGVPTPAGGSVWHPTNLPRLLKNPAYHGERTHRGDVVGFAVWPALLPDELWWPLQAKLSDPQRLTRREGTVTEHFLTGLALCGICRGRLYIGRNRGALSYWCKDGLGHLSRSEARVDEVVNRLVVARLNEPDVLSATAADNDPGVAEAAAELAQLRARLDAFVDSAAAGELSPAALGRIEARLGAEIRAAEAAVRRRAIPPVLVDVVGVSLDDWLTLPMTARREVVRVLGDVIVEPAGRGKRVFDPSLVRIDWR